MSLLDCDINTIDIIAIENLCIQATKNWMGSRHLIANVELLNTVTDANDILGNPNEYILGRYMNIKNNTYDIAIFKVDSFFYRYYPAGTYKSLFYLDPKWNLSTLLNL